MAHDEVLAAAKDAFIRHQSEIVRNWTHDENRIGKLGLLSEETLLKVVEVVSNPQYGENTGIRLMMLFSTSQKRGLERVVRDVVLFADVAAQYRGSLKMSVNAWKLLYPVEEKARAVVCGKHIVFESVEQGESMRAVFHGVMALIRNSLISHGHGRLDRNSAGWAWMEINQTEHIPMLDFFAAHPESAPFLAEYVVERGLSDPEVLAQVVESHAALSTGVL